MKREDFNSRISEIGALDDVVTIREKLTELHEEMGKDFDRMSELETENQNLTQRNEQLTEANRGLYLRVTTQKSADEITKLDTGLDNKPKPEPINKSYMELFNERR